MRNEDISEGLQELLSHANRLSELSEKLLSRARSSEHQALAEKLERLHDGTKEHIAQLQEHATQLQSHPPSPPGTQKSALPKSVAHEDAEGEDDVTESSMESFPASDAPGGY